jgi:hypothetical protein
MLTAHDKSLAEAKILDLGLHMRNKRVAFPGEEGSYYGGNLYDASVQNGSVGGGVAGTLPPLDIHVLGKIIWCASACFVDPFTRKTW